MNKIIYFILLFLITLPVLAEETFSGKVFISYEESEDLSKINKTPQLEISKHESLVLNSDSATFEVYQGKNLVISGERSGVYINNPRIVSVESLPTISPTAPRVRQSSSALNLLVGIFDLPTASVLTDITSTVINENLLTDPTRSLKKVFEVNSYDAITVNSVRAATRVTLALSDPPLVGGCYGGWYTSFLTAARAAFAAQGIDETTYDRVLFIVPTLVGTNCGFAGVAISSRDTLYSNNISPSLAAHEIGHNIGFGHAAKDDNNDGYTDPGQAYGDASCVMSVFGGHYNLMHTPKRNWFLGAGGILHNYSANGINEILMSPSESAPSSAPQKQLVSIQPAAGARPYIITFRKNIGDLGSFYNLDSFANNKLYIYRPRVELSNNTMLVSELYTGDTFRNDADQVSIAFTSESSNVATVKFTLGPVDTDGDGQLDSLDADDDNDGVIDSLDCSPIDSTRWTKSAYIDFDYDGVRTSNEIINPTFYCVGTAPGVPYTLNNSGAIDNCSGTYNPDQADADRDGLGDVCDSTPNGTSGGGGSGGSGGGGSPTVTPIGGGPAATPTPVIGLYSTTLTSILVGKSPKSSTLRFVAYSSSIPGATCAIKAPGKRAYAAAKSAISESSYTGFYAFRCSLKTEKKYVGKKYYVKVATSLAGYPSQSQIVSFKAK